MSEVRESRFVAGWYLETVLRAGFTVDADPALMTGNAAGLTAVNVVIILSTHRISTISLSFTLTLPHSTPNINPLPNLRFLGVGKKFCSCQCSHYPVDTKQISHLLYLPYPLPLYLSIPCQPLVPFGGGGCDGREERTLCGIKCFYVPKFKVMNKAFKIWLKIDYQISNSSL